MKEGYKLWHGFLNTLPKLTRYTLGKKIDDLFVEILLLSYKVKFCKRQTKLTKLHELSEKFDQLKYLVTLLWEIKGIDDKKYKRLATKFAGIGKMLGGWIDKTK